MPSSIGKDRQLGVCPFKRRGCTERDVSMGIFSKDNLYNVMISIIQGGKAAFYSG